MIAHLCRLAWNRRGTNLLLVAELLLSFLVLTPLVAGWVLFLAEERKPLGFDHEGIWSASVRNRDFNDPEGSLRTIELVRQELQTLDGVETVALASTGPFGFGQTWNGISYVYISNEGLEVLGPRLLRGRWFGPEDEVPGWTAAVIDEELSRTLFGGQDPLGKAIEDSPVIDLQGGFELPFPGHVRVVGVVESCSYFRRYRDVEVPGHIFFQLPERWSWVSRESDDSIQGAYFSSNDNDGIDNYGIFHLGRQGGGHYLVKAFPGTGPAFGETLRSRIKAVAPTGQSVRLKVDSLGDLLESSRQSRLGNLKRLGMIGCPMMLMVVLGLIGVMWQNVHRRTREIGIRRAAGAPGGRIYGQFLGELAVLVTAAIALGCFPILQFGLLNLIWRTLIPAYVIACGVGVTAVVLYLLVLLCGLYPSWLAARVRPAEALHHD